jgi:hypothetical protein
MARPFIILARRFFNPEIPPPFHFRPVRLMNPPGPRLDQTTTAGCREASFKRSVSASLQFALLHPQPVVMFCVSMGAEPYFFRESLYAGT